MSHLIMERLYLSAALFISIAALARIFLIVHRRRIAARSKQNPLIQMAADGKPTLLYFWTATCGQCRPQEREIERAQAALRETGDILAVQKLNAFDDPELAKSLHVFTVPTTVVFNAQGTVAAWNPGFAPAWKLLEQIRQAA